MPGGSQPGLQSKTPPQTGKQRRKESEIADEGGKEGVGDNSGLA